LSTRRAGGIFKGKRVGEVLKERRASSAGERVGKNERLWKDKFHVRKEVRQLPLHILDFGDLAFDIR
jgi:hypothetical protein